MNKDEKLVVFKSDLTRLHDDHMKALDELQELIAKGLNYAERWERLRKILINMKEEAPEDYYDLRVVLSIMKQLDQDYEDEES
jgi:hypothetical protein